LVHAVILFGASILKVGNGFYLPGVLPQSFSEGDEVKLKVNKVTSPKSLLSMDYYLFVNLKEDLKEIAKTWENFCQEIGLSLLRTSYT
jgi:hypothetical protein